MELVRDVLQVKGHETAGGHHGGGRHRARQRGKSPDLILMDIQLPAHERHRRICACRAQSGDGEHSDRRVTASVMQQDRTKITAAGFDGYVGKPFLTKPIDETLLYRTLARYLGD